MKIIKIGEIKNEDIICPFCKEGDFDLVGLKSHLSNGDCEIYNNTANRKRMFQENPTREQIT